MNEKSLKNLKKGGITTDTAPRLGANGGRKAAIAKREKKLMSQLYGEYLAERFDIEMENGESKSLTGSKLVGEVIKKIMLSGGSPAVSMMKEIREATEGSKIETNAKLTYVFDPALEKEFGKGDK
jgi:hypothetical protein